MKIRMFVDDVSGIGLWPDLGWDYPGSPFGHLFEAELEDGLPISHELRESIRSWVDEYTKSIDAPRSAAQDTDHDRRGLRLCEQLQDELKDADFLVQYQPHTEVVRQEMKASKRSRSD